MLWLSPSVPSSCYICVCRFPNSGLPYECDHTVCGLLCFLSYNIAFPRFIRVVACVSTSFLFKAESCGLQISFCWRESIWILLFRKTSLFIEIKENLGSLFLKERGKQDEMKWNEPTLAPDGIYCIYAWERGDKEGISDFPKWLSLWLGEDQNPFRRVSAFRSLKKACILFLTPF